ncbi:MAG: DegT/DnrJ/EryC1/StrS family aminotransferase [Armatimonadota bacterium]
MYRIGQEEIDEISKVIQSGQLFRVGDKSTGFLGECDAFEEEWAAHTNKKYALLMAGGGTAALICALAALGIGPGDEVIVPAYTWLATASSVLAVGAIPVLADIDDTLGLDPDDFEAKITPNVKAVIPVHMVGRPANLERIIAIARNYNIKVVEDSCQMVGGSYHGRKTGSWGDAGAYSFNYFKVISCGEGGALVTDDESVYENASIYHDSGTCFRPKAMDLATPIFVAQQYRANEIMGAMMRIQLRRLDGILKDLREARKRLEASIACSAIKIAPSNDPVGDCGVALTLQFDDSQAARLFASDFCRGYLGIDHGKHIYTEWTPIREKRVNHHPDMNPFNFPQNQGLRADYSDEVCSHSLDILRRTYFVPINPEWTSDEIDEVSDRIQKAGNTL